MTDRSVAVQVSDPLHGGHRHAALFEPRTWEREGEDKEYFKLFSPAGYALGVNIVLYAMTH